MTRTARVVCYSVQCPECSNRMFKSVAELIGRNELRCEGTNGCGAMINLQSGEASTVITDLWHACQEIDNKLAKSN